MSNIIIAEKIFADTVPHCEKDECLGLVKPGLFDNDRYSSILTSNWIIKKVNIS